MNPTIGISGVATSGKDTFGNLLIEELAQRGFKARRFALADELKKQVAPFIFDLYGIDIFNCTLAEKNLVRPILVGHGEIKRATTEGTYWLTLLDKTIATAQAEEPGLIPIVTDVRYAFFPNDEFFWIKRKDGLVVHVQRYNKQREERNPMYVEDVVVPPANETEAKHDGALREKADYKVLWPTCPSKTASEIDNWCRPYVIEFLRSKIADPFLQRCQ